MRAQHSSCTVFTWDKDQLSSGEVCCDGDKLKAFVRFIAFFSRIERRSMMLLSFAVQTVAQAVYAKWNASKISDVPRPTDFVLGLVN